MAGKVGKAGKGEMKSKGSHDAGSWVAGWKVQREVNAQNQGWTGFSGLNLRGRTGRAGWHVDGGRVFDEGFGEPDDITQRLVTGVE